MFIKEFFRLYRLRFAWWNLAISSTATTKSKPADYDGVTSDILKIMVKHDVSFLAVCEVSSDDVKQIRARLPKPYQIMDLTFKAGRTRFDTAVVFNNNILNVKHIVNLNNKVRNQTIKAGQKLIVTEKNYYEEFSVYIAHWSSRLSPDGESRRFRAAQILGQSALDDMKKNDQVIILGDFNDNPFDESVIQLGAVRCHDSTRKLRKETLYNPFWRNVVSQKTYNHIVNDEDHFHSGTHFYPTAFDSNWHTFDQILVSGNFLGGNNWHLQECQTGVLDNIYFLQHILDKSSPYDHLPIVCEIIRPEVN